MEYGHSYWRRVRSRAFSETFSALRLDSKRIVLSAALLAFVVLGLRYWGSEGSIGDRMVEALAVLGALSAAFMVVFAAKMIAVPGEMDRELREMAVLRELRYEEQVAELQVRLGERPEARLHLREEGRTWYLEIENVGADADFQVRIDLSETGIFGKPKHIAFAQWQDGSSDTEHHIPAGAFDRVYVYGLDFGGGASISDDIRWVDHAGVNNGRGYSWHPGTVPETGPSTHRLTLIVSAKPPLQSGNKIVVLDVTGGDLEIIEGEIESAPGHPNT